MGSRFPGKDVPISATTLSMDDLVRIFERLKTHVDEEADRVLATEEKNPDQTDEEFEAFKKHARSQAFRITVTINGKGGENYFGDDSSVFASPNLPDEITAVYLTNKNSFRTFTGNEPLNSFEIWLDFSSFPILDAKNPVSYPSPNISKLKIDGDRDSWVAAIHEVVFGVLNSRKNGRGWLHRGHAYDIGLMIVGLPFGFYLCAKLSPFVTEYIGDVHGILSGATYVYVMLLSLWAYRFLFEYARWVLPNVELKGVSSLSGKHRFVLGSIVVAVIGSFISEAVI